MFISPCPSAYLSFLAPAPPTVQGTVRVELAWVRPEAQLLQLPICFPSCDTVQPIPLGSVLLFQTQKLKEPMTLLHSQRRHPGWRGADSWADRWPSQVRVALLARSLTASWRSLTRGPRTPHTYVHTHPQCGGITPRPASSQLGTAPHHSSASLSPPFLNPYHTVTAGVMGCQPDKQIHAKVLPSQPLYRPQCVSRRPSGRSLTLDISGPVWVMMGWLGEAVRLGDPKESNDFRKNSVKMQF